MVREKFNQIIAQEAHLGFQRGIDLFLESLNSEIERDEAITENGVDAYLDYLVESAKA